MISRRGDDSQKKNKRCDSEITRCTLAMRKQEERSQRTQGLLVLDNMSLSCSQDLGSYAAGTLLLPVDAAAMGAEQEATWTNTEATSGTTWNAEDRHKLSA